MKTLCLILCTALFSSNALAEDNGDQVAIRECLRKWGKHPFEGKNPSYRTISTTVKVMGIGGDVNDDQKTEKAELVLVKPGVAVMSKTLYTLNNPNGWYCLKGRVAVMGKMEFDIHCTANLASSEDDVAVLGSSDQKTGGVSVLGSVRIKRMCQGSK
jgi:hypothetical protein